MTHLTERQRQLLVAALRSRGYITAVVTMYGEVTVGAGRERVRGPAGPIDGLVAAELLNLVAEYADREGARPVRDIAGVRLYELTPAGRAVAMDAEIGPAPGAGGEPRAGFGRRRSMR